MNGVIVTTAKIDTQKETTNFLTHVIVKVTSEATALGLNLEQMRCWIQTTHHQIIINKIVW